MFVNSTAIASTALQDLQAINAIAAWAGCMEVTVLYHVHQDVPVVNVI